LLTMPGRVRISRLTQSPLHQSDPLLFLQAKSDHVRVPAKPPLTTGC